MSFPILTVECLYKNCSIKSGQSWRFIQTKYISKKQDKFDKMIKGLGKSALEDDKGAYPKECEYFDDVLKAAFRYPPYSDEHSRFRPKGANYSVLYTSSGIETSAAEVIYRPLLFRLDIPEKKRKDNILSYTSFNVDYQGQVLDLTDGELKAYHSLWQENTDYTYCHKITEQALNVGVQIIVNISVRCSKQGKTINILDPKAVKYELFNQNNLEDWVFYFDDLNHKVIAENSNQKIELDYRSIIANVSQ